MQYLRTNITYSTITYKSSRFDYVELLLCQFNWPHQSCSFVIVKMTSCLISEFKPSVESYIVLYWRWLTYLNDSLTQAFRYGKYPRWDAVGAEEPTLVSISWYSFSCFSGDFPSNQNIHIRNWETLNENLQGYIHII